MTRVVFETATLADTIKKAAKIAPNSGQAFDKAAGVVLEISPEPLPATVRATDLLVFYREWIDVVEWPDKPVTWRLPSSVLAQVLSSLPIGTGKTVTLEEKAVGHSIQVHVSSGRTKARFNLLDARYFPEWAVFDPDKLYKASDLGGRVASVSWAAAKSEVPISGVHLTGEVACATDRYRMAAAPLPIPDLDTPITVPGGALANVLKATGNISIGVEGTQLLIMPDEHTQIRAVIYAEKYPPIERAMRRDHPASFKVKKTDLLEIMNRANNFSGGDRIPTMRVFLGKEEFAVMMANDEIGLLGDVVEVPGHCTHDRIEYKFTPKNLIDSISNTPNEQIDIFYYPENTNMQWRIDGGSGYEAWVAPRAERSEQ